MSSYSYHLVETCAKLKVILKKDVLKYQDQKQGVYELSDDVHGKPSWTSSSMAIWYIPVSKVWGIGPLESIGSSIVGIFGPNNVLDYPHEIKQWNYVIDENTIETATETDVIIKCMDSDGMDSEGMNSIFFFFKEMY